jgi:two-component system OmpR family sensor kinase
MQSLGRTLSVRFSITMFIALTVIAMWAWIGANRVLQQELDNGLAAAAHFQSSFLAAGLPLPPQPRVDLEQERASRRYQFVIERKLDGALLTTSTALAEDFPFDSAALRRAGTGQDAWSTEAWHDEQMRSFYLSIPDQTGASSRVLQTAVSLAPIRAASRNVLFLMFGTVLLGMVATVLGARWLAQSAVSPVSEIAAQAEAIRPGQVDQRITAHAGVSEFNGLVRVLNQMLARLDQGVLAQRRIISDVSHDLRTPVTVIRGEVEVALRKPRSPEQYQAVLGSLLEEVNYLETLSDSLLTLARIEAGELVPVPIQSDLADVVEGAVRRMQHRSGNRTITLCPSQDGVTNATFDPQLVGLAVDQLLDNAILHTPEGTTVEVSAVSDGDTVTVTAEDDGPGVPTETLPHLFERFYRGDAARGRTAGAGLGLTVAAAIVRAHRGSMVAERGRNGGLRVVMVLPRALNVS